MSLWEKLRCTSNKTDRFCFKSNNVAALTKGSWCPACCLTCVFSCSKSKCVMWTCLNASLFLSLLVQAVLRGNVPVQLADGDRQLEQQRQFGSRHLQSGESLTRSHYISRNFTYVSCDGFVWRLKKKQPESFFLHFTGS